MQMLARGVWQLKGFPRHWFNVYLVEDVLIDAATRWSRRRILRQLRDRPVRLIALTHCHPDHQGAVHALCTQLDVPVACHEADVPVLEGRAPVAPYTRAIRLSERLFAGPPHPVAQKLHEGDEVAGFRVIHAPGHTPGHVLFFRQSDRVMLAGDVVMNLSFLTGRPCLREPPEMFTCDPIENRRAIQTLVDLKPKLVCFGHGPPLRHPELLDVLAARLAHRPGLVPQLQHG